MLSRLVLSKNNLFFAFLIFGYLFGVTFYDFIGFSYVDELMALFLVVFAGMIVIERKNWKELKSIGILTGILLFYLIYSFIIKSNTPGAIIMDFLTQIKPFLGFYCTLLIAPRLTIPQKRFLSILCIIIAGGLLILGFIDTNFLFFGHQSRYATAIVVTFFLLCYCSTNSWSDIMILLLILTIGLISTRSKFYGFWAIAIFLMIYVKVGGEIHFNIKTASLFIGLLFIAVWLAKDKIILYYVDGMMNSREMWSRPAMMLTSIQILYDYFPFGSGLASFGTFASAEYYSPTYAVYGLDHLWGLSKEMPTFICDAFYPELAQFGVVGVILYFTFWGTILRKSAKELLPEIQLFVLLIFLFFLIEGIADATVTQNRGLFILILLGLALSPNK